MSLLLEERAQEGGEDAPRCGDETWASETRQGNDTNKPGAPELSELVPGLDALWFELTVINRLCGRGNGAQIRHSHGLLEP